MVSSDISSGSSFQSPFFGNSSSHSFVYVWEAVRISHGGMRAEKSVCIMGMFGPDVLDFGKNALLCSFRCAEDVLP